MLNELPKLHLSYLLPRWRSRTRFSMFTKLVRFATQLQPPPFQLRVRRIDFYRVPTGQKRTQSLCKLNMFYFTRSISFKTELIATHNPLNPHFL
jgi:hypothetical protein